MDGIELQNLIDEALGLAKKKKDEATRYFKNALIRTGLKEGVRDKSEMDLRTIEPPGGTSSSTYSMPRITTKQIFKERERKSIDV